MNDKLIAEQDEREAFEAMLNVHSRRRNEHGDYVLPSIQDRWSGWQARATHSAQTAPQPEQSGLPDVCDGKEQEAFEEFARGERMDMTTHPLHWLFLNEKTNAARQGWKAAIRYCRAQQPENKK